MTSTRFHKISRDSSVHAGKVRISLTRFEKQRIVSIDEIAKAIEILPDSHLTNLATIIYDPDRHMSQLWSHAQTWYSTVSNWDGMYFTPRPYDLLGPSYIFIFRVRPKEQFLSLLYHEVGHHVFSRIISGDSRYAWVNDIVPHWRPVSSYARTNAEEAFAEAYSAFLIRPETLDEASRNFMFHTVFRGFSPKREVLVSGKAPRRRAA